MFDQIMFNLLKVSALLLAYSLHIYICRNLLFIQVLPHVLIMCINQCIHAEQVHNVLKKHNFSVDGHRMQHGYHNRSDQIYKWCIWTKRMHSSLSTENCTFMKTVGWVQSMRELFGPFFLFLSMPLSHPLALYTGLYNKQ